ncbi:glycerol-3-phosphate dehydrogenase [Sulfoacidibacillus thermotolerans]|uniref:Glycerol-3-phosphate dehydrogenase [NAD(P)+] n=1 Tax=Sulfoacidibacillus thermotolerans TaxID=1765684 RepID=A0A2U3DCT2_SULT2|nr:glycerol-3-phosphate dehydrogenase [Sulfoacidibacillus thermotolerans]
MIQRIAVVGAGSFGSALASVFATNGHEVTLLARRDSLIQEINQHHTNKQYLPGVSLHPAIFATSDEKHIANADLIVLVVPSHAMRETCERIAPLLQSKSKVKVAHATKGLEVGTMARMSTVILDSCPFLQEQNLAVLSGPSHAEEVSRELPTTLVVASASKSTAEYIQDMLMNRVLRVYTNPDVVGAELGGALKNIIALGCGISDGLGYGDNARAAIMTRGLVEISRLGIRLGAAFNTFSGLTGVGDLIVTCTSRHSRNWNAGYLLGQGFSLDDALQKVGMVVEGVRTTKVALAVANEVAVPMPIASAIGDILFNQKSPRLAVDELMSRTRTHEMEPFIQDATTGWMFP